MCMGCMANADFALTSGVLGAAAARVGLRRFIPTWRRSARRVTDEEAAVFVEALRSEMPVAPRDELV